MPASTDFNDDNSFGGLAIRLLTKLRVDRLVVPLRRIRFRNMSVALVVTFCFLTNAATVATAQVCKTDANANTLNTLTSIPGAEPIAYTYTGLTVSINKLSTQSQLFYTNQITYQFASGGPYGALFQMRVKNSSGTYIMPNMQTGSVAQYGGTYYNAFISDTVYDTQNGAAPPPGVYTFELWAAAASGTLQIVPNMSNIAVLEIPYPYCTK
jgi:hypothetical protein